MADLKRRPGTREATKYPNAKEFVHHRREFIALLAKGALGASVLGVMGCNTGDSGAGDGPALPDVSDVAYPGGMEVPPDTHLPGDDTVVAPDVVDVVEDEWTTAGVDMGPELPDLKDAGTDQEYVIDGIPSMPDEVSTGDLTDIHDWDGPAGVPPMPDTIDAVEDVEDEFPPLAGVPRMPDTVEPEE